MSSSAIKATIWEDTAPYFMARVYDSTGYAAEQADFTSISYVVVDMRDTATAVTSGTLTVSSVIFDTLQRDDPRWIASSDDSDGYNLGFALAATAFPTGGRTYRVDLNCDMVSGEDMGIVFEVVTKSRYRPS